MNPTRPGYRPSSSTHEEIIQRIRFGHGVVRSWSQWRATLESHLANMPATVNSGDLLVVGGDLGEYRPAEVSEGVYTPAKVWDYE